MPSELSNGDSAAAALSMRERRKGGNERVQELEDVTVEVMHALSANSGARSGVRAPKGKQVLPPVGHVGD